MNDLIAIGDIHGDIECLSELLLSIQNKYQTYIFLGDYIDRGLNSKEVIDALVDFSKKQDCIFLKGNHESMFLKYLENGDTALYAKYGGLQTILSYLKGEAKGDIHKKLLEQLPESHKVFLNSLRENYALGKYIFIHDINKISKLSDELVYIHGHGKNHHSNSSAITICLNQDMKQDMRILTYAIDLK